ncbi:hypothetical protein [Pseudomonas agarici]|uniref:hypothetical protein n=1 Tax=Pseudomonas agarici TaxID=46677 RepID=UPI0003064524|nr:hypothetical protein [Pseudomonas agarici]NWB90159.1 hypothetical protein [Pseudomonas agarici]NWC08910.1 hypothetical protein [Pseudomonas agarici]SEK61108.1 hypothetical protein SAMN05216604_104247 [Pseudomonas agarici]
MKRQRTVSFHVSPLHWQQGLFALFALLVTLIVGQAFQRWSQPLAEARSVPFHAPIQTHFSAVGSASDDGGAYTLTPVEQAEPVADMPLQERWVF